MDGPPPPPGMDIPPPPMDGPPPPPMSGPPPPPGPPAPPGPPPPGPPAPPGPNNRPPGSKPVKKQKVVVPRMEKILRVDNTFFKTIRSINLDEVSQRSLLETFQERELSPGIKIS